MFIMAGNTAKGYEISNSVRLRSAAGAYFNRTMTTTNRRTFTLSLWLKRTNLAQDRYSIMSAGSGSVDTLFWFSSGSGAVGDSLEFAHYNAGYTFRLHTNSVFRDPTAWMHIVLAVDTTQVTSTDRVKVYVNGSLQSFAAGTSYPAQNFDTFFNYAAYSAYLGKYNTIYIDQYLSDVYFIDGQALTPASFAQTDGNGVWIPRSYTGNYGTNGFHFDFKDIATTSGSNAGLGKDVSGNGNYWNTNNISVTAGATYDAMTDTPTNNYPTIGAIDYTSMVCSYGNLRTTYSGAGNRQARSAFAMPAGKWYWEMVVSTYTSSVQAGIANSAVTLFDTNGLGYQAGSISFGGGAVYNQGTYITTSIPTLTTGDVIGCAFDAINGIMYFAKQTGGTGSFVWILSHNPSAGTGGYTGFTNGPYFPATNNANNGVADHNFGQRPFNIGVNIPTGYKALCTANLPAVAVTKPSSYFGANTRAGTAGTYSVTGKLFQPDLVWTKSAGRVLDHAVYDSVRGAQKRLETNNTDAEVTGDSTGLTTFNNDGYTGGALDQINGTTATNSFIDWMWKASAAAGINIVTFAAPASGNSSIAHGLGQAPAMAIVKCRGATGEWSVYHKNLTTPATYRLKLNLTDAQANVANSWLNTSSVDLGYLVGTTAVASQTHVAYCFAEITGFSKFSSYAGNGAADGPVVYCGFKPGWLMVKRIDAAGAEWNIVDSARSSYNGVSLRVYADSSAAENSTGGIPYVDFTATGFKVRSTNTDWNASAGVYIFAAFAERPFGGANIAPSPAG